MQEHGVTGSSVARSATARGLVEPRSLSHSGTAGRSFADVPAPVHGPLPLRPSAFRHPPTRRRLRHLVAPARRPMDRRTSHRHDDRSVLLLWPRQGVGGLQLAVRGADLHFCIRHSACVGSSSFERRWHWPSRRRCIASSPNASRGFCMASASQDWRFSPSRCCSRNGPGCSRFCFRSSRSTQSSNLRDGRRSCAVLAVAARICALGEYSHPVCLRSDAARPGVRRADARPLAPAVNRLTKGQVASAPAGWWQLCGLTVACFLATLVTPYHVKIYGVILEYATQPGPYRFINELKALEFREIPDWVMLAFAGWATYALGRRSHQGYFDLLLLTLTAFLAFRMRRDMWIVILDGAVHSQHAVRGPPFRRKSVSGGRVGGPSAFAAACGRHACCSSGRSGTSRMRTWSAKRRNCSR